MPLSKVASVFKSEPPPVAGLDPAVDLTASQRPGLRLSDYFLRNACVVAALSVLIVVTIVSIVTKHDLSRGPSSIRNFLMTIAASTALQMLIGVVAGFLIHAILRRYATLAAITLAAVIVYPAVSPSLESIAYDLDVWRRIGVQVWCWTPFVMLLTTAALSAIPRRLFESAALDRIGRSFTLGNITLPLVAPLLVLCLLFLLTRALHEQLPGEPIDPRLDARAYLMLAYATLIVAIGAGALSSRFINRRKHQPSTGGA